MDNLMLVLLFTCSCTCSTHTDRHPSPRNDCTHTSTLDHVLAYEHVYKLFNTHMLLCQVSLFVRLA
jgi:hypothetical protein